MDHPTFMTHMQLGRPSAGLLRVAGDLVERFEAHAVGIAACQPIQVAYADGYAIDSGDIFEQDRKAVETELKAAETDFRKAVGNRAQSVAFRSTITYAPLADYIANEARCADLVITERRGRDPIINDRRRADLGELLMSIGRPVLVLPEKLESLTLGRALIAWKDTPEARRAVLAALPFLKACSQVSIVEIAGVDEEDDAQLHVSDVSCWLRRHGVSALGSVQPAIHEDAHRLSGIVNELQPDLIVGGVYGHSRLREWIFGGVSRDFLLKSDRSLLLAH